MKPKNVVRVDLCKALGHLWVAGAWVRIWKCSRPDCKAVREGEKRPTK